jgi:hypothetical protein
MYRCVCIYIYNADTHQHGLHIYTYTYICTDVPLHDAHVEADCKVRDHSVNAQHDCSRRIAPCKPAHVCHGLRLCIRACIDTYAFCQNVHEHNMIALDELLHANLRMCVMDLHLCIRACLATYAVSQYALCAFKLTSKTPSERALVCLSPKNDSELFCFSSVTRRWFQKLKKKLKKNRSLPRSVLRST